MRIQFKYKNHEGKIEDRDIDMVFMGFDFTSHPDFGYQPGWVIAGWDYSRGRDGSPYRSFHLHNIILPETGKVSLFNWALLKFPRERRPGDAVPSTDKVREFAMWLTSRPQVITVGASITVYEMIDALEEYEKLKGPSHGQPLVHNNPELSPDDHYLEAQHILSEN